jgi:hypothetical protein
MLDRLYRSSEKDIASGDAFVRRYYRQLNGAAAALATITVDDAANPCPSDVVRLIQSVSIRWIPGAAQFASHANFNVIDSPTAEAAAIVTQSPLNQVAAQTQDYTVGGLALVQMQGEYFRASGFFNAGAANNNVNFYICGLEFPRGTFRR